jgi:ribosomal protein L24
MPRLYNGIPSSAGQKKSYIHGLLALSLRRTAVVEIQIPAPESITLHQESRCDPAFVQSTLHTYAAQHWIEGDLVRVRAGEMFGCAGKIVCVDMSTRSASVHMEESVQIEKISHEPLMFSISDLERKFRVGDAVRVLDNTTVALQLKGKTGTVVQVDDDVVDVVDQSCDLEVSYVLIFIASLIF